MLLINASFVLKVNLGIMFSFVRARSKYYIIQRVFAFNEDYSRSYAWGTFPNCISGSLH